MGPVVELRNAEAKLEPKARAVKACFEGKISPMAPASILRCHPNATVYLATNSAWLLGPELQATLRADTGDGDLVTISQEWTSSNASAAGTCVNVFSGSTASQLRAPSRHNPAATRNEAVQP